MNLFDFTQPGGFPLDQDVLNFNQDNVKLVMQTAHLAGNLAILSGCAVVGTTVTAGYVVINGEVLSFQAGEIEPKVRIVETKTKLNYEDGEDREVQIVRVAKFGDDGITTLLWANFKRNTVEGVLARLDRLEWLQRPFLGAGGMVWWKGTIESIPAGWREVEEWRGKLPLAAKAPNGAGVRPAGFDIGNTGGAETVTMKLENLIAHTHNSGSTTQSLEWDDGGRFRNERVPGGDNTSSTGSENPTPMNVLNPYKVGCWIEPIPNYLPPIA